MKFLLRTAAILITFLTLFSLVSCSTGNSEEIPAGCILASAPGADFRLYVPSTWNPETDYGVSCAYYSLSVQSTVSANRYPESSLGTSKTYADENEKLEDFFETNCRAPLANAGNTLISEAEKKPAMLGTLNALHFEFDGVINGTKNKFRYTVAKKDGFFYVLSFTVADELYEALANDVATIEKHFVFADPYEPLDYAKSIPDKDAPEGMKLASNKTVAYTFYVPENWIVNRDEKIFAAYREDDRSSISVVPYSPDVDRMSVAEFFTMGKDRLTALFGEENYTLGSVKDTTLGGRTARDYTYRIVIEGKTYCFRQVIAAYKSMLYSVTLTTDEAHFEERQPEMDAVIGTFAFR